MTAPHTPAPTAAPRAVAGGASSTDQPAPVHPGAPTGDVSAAAAAAGQLATTAELVDPAPTPDRPPRRRVPKPDRSWTLEEVRAAVELAHGTGARGGPDTAALADAVGLSRRQVQRWLAGDTRPTPEGLEALRRALLPDPGILTRQRQDAALAAQAVADIAVHDHNGPATPTMRMWRNQGWLAPHLVVVIEHPELHVRRVAVINAREDNEALHRLVTRPPRPDSTPGRTWTVLDQAPVPTHFHGLLVKAAILDRATHWRTAVDPVRLPRGHADTWLDSAPRFSVRGTARTLGISTRRNTRKVS